MGAEHRDTIGTSHSLANALAALHQDRAASVLYERVLAWHRQNRLPEFWAGRFLLDFGRFEAGRQEFEGGEGLLREAVNLRRAAGAGPLAIAEALGALAHCLIGSGKSEPAAALLRGGLREIAADLEVDSEPSTRQISPAQRLLAEGLAELYEGSGEPLAAAPYRRWLAAGSSLGIAL